MSPAPAPAEQLARPPAGAAAATTGALLLLAPTLAVFVLTQRLAQGLAYNPLLGPPLVVPALPAPVYAAGTLLAAVLAVWLLRRPSTRPLAVLLTPVAVAFGALLLGPLYPPLAGLRWLPPLLKNAAVRPLAVEALALALACLAGFGAVALLPLKLRRSDVAAIAHGSSRLATLADLEAASLASPAGVRLGMWKEGRRRLTLSDDSQDHVLLIMPTGAGKTSGHIIPTLLSSTDPAFILDPKGELWQTTSGWRRRQGHRCLLFAPTSVEPDAVAWNCLDEVRRGPQMMLDLRVVAESFITSPAGEPGQSHWTASAQRLFLLLALHLIQIEEAPDMAAVRSLLNDPETSLRELFVELLTFEHDPSRGFRSPKTGEPTATHPEVAMLARSFLSTPDREMGSIVSTLQRFLALWADPIVAHTTRRSDFSLTQLLSREPPTSLYVALPYGDLEPLAPLLRILLALLIRRMTEGERYSDAGRATGRHRTLFLLDEFAALGRLPILERMLGFFRGYGIRAVIVVQDLAQLVRNYSVHETITGNCQVHVAAATQSAPTRGHLSALAGEATVRYRRRSDSGGLGRWGRARTTVADTEVRRPLLTHGEMGTLGKDRLLILKTGTPPVLAWKAPYFTEEDLVARSRLPPPQSSRQREAAPPPLPVPLHGTPPEPEAP